MAILPYNFLTTPRRTSFPNSALNSRSNEGCLLSKDIRGYRYVYVTCITLSLSDDTECFLQKPPFSR